MDSIQEKKEFSAGLIVYRNTPQGPRFLLLYHGGRYWNFPKGHIEDRKNAVPSFGEEAIATSIRETSKEAAIRETQEETGISPDKLFIKRNFKMVEQFRFKRNKEPISKTVIFYLAETSEANIKISAEHEGFAWFQYRDARYILSMYKDSQRLLLRAYEYIRPRLPLRTRQSFSRTRDNLQQSPLKPSDQV